MDFNESRLHEAPWTFIRMREFFPPVNSISWNQTAFEWGSVYCSRRIFIVRKKTEIFGFWVVPVHSRHAGLWPRLHEHNDHWWRVLGVLIRAGNQIAPSFTLQWKSEKSTKYYLTQMLLAIKWRYWHRGKSTHTYEVSRSPHAITLHWIPSGFRKKIRSDTFLTDLLLRRYDCAALLKSHTFWNVQIFYTSKLKTGPRNKYYDYFILRIERVSICE